MLRVLTEQVAGYYDPKSGEFHLADWIDLDGQRARNGNTSYHALPGPPSGISICGRFEAVGPKRFRC